MTIVNVSLMATTWVEWWSDARLTPVARSAMLLVLGLPLVHIASAAAGRLVRKRMTEQAGMLAGKGIYYFGITLVLVMVMQNMGFQLTAILGAAGVIGIAVGFASQTSLSNVISGLFLIWEHPFEAGDMIKVGDTVGFVLSVDLLSVKLRTSDNRFVRIPNETLIKTQVINISRFPIRRLDIDIGVAYKENIGRAMEILTEVADQNQWSLDEPRPVVVFKEFGDSALELMLGVWFARQDFLNLKNSLMKEIKERFDSEGIEIAFPHVTVYSGSDTPVFPVRVTQDELIGNASLRSSTEGKD